MPETGSSHFGPYEILGPLKGGGQGKVYRARDPRLKRFVALKVLHDSNGHDPLRQARLLQEAQAASALNHQNIVVVYDVGIEGDEPFIVSELIDGSSLRDVMASGPMSVAELLAVAVQIADGLTAAHEAGLVHRDIKPENVMVTPDRHAKILDFGIAKAVGAAGLAAETTDNPRTRQTETIDGVIKGTIPYMSPEQARGGHVDFRSDQFSFGLVLYEMAAGRRAFAQDTLDQTRRGIIEDEPRSLGEVNPKTPVLLRWIVERCLAKAPEKRYAATADLARDLRMLRDHLKEIPTSQPIAPTLTPRRRWPIVPAAAASGAVAVAVLAAMLWPPAPAVPRFTPLASDASYQGMPAWSPDGNTIAYVADVDGVRQVFTRGVSSSKGAQITQARFDCRDPFWSHDGSRVYYLSAAGEKEGIYSVSAAGGPPEAEIPDADSATLSPDGRTLAFFRSDTTDSFRQLWLASPPRSEPKHYTQEPIATKKLTDAVPRYSPDGSKLAVWGGSYDDPELRLWIIPTSGAAPRAVGIPKVLTTNNPPLFDWLSDNRRIVAAVEHEGVQGVHLWIVDTESGQMSPLTSGAGHESAPAFSLEGHRIAYSREDTNFDLLEVPLDGAPIRTLLATSRNELDAAWSPTRPEYAFVTDRNGPTEIWLRSGDGVWERPLVTAASFPPNEVTYTFRLPAFSPDGQRIAFEHVTNFGAAIWVAALAGGPPVQVTRLEHRNIPSTYSPTWSPDGEWIAFAQAGTGHWTLNKVRAGTATASQALHDVTDLTHPQWSSDNRWIACTTTEGLTLVSPDGNSVKTFEDAGQGWIVYAWSQDAKTLYGLKQSEDSRHLIVVSLDVESGKERVLNGALAPLPPINVPVKGFSRMSATSYATALVHLKSDIWLIDDFLPQQRLIDRLWAHLPS